MRSEFLIDLFAFISQRIPWAEPRYSHSDTYAHATLLAGRQHMDIPHRTLGSLEVCHQHDEKSPTSEQHILKVERQQNVAEPVSIEGDHPPHYIGESKISFISRSRNAGGRKRIPVLRRRTIGACLIEATQSKKFAVCCIFSILSFLRET
jgi:hypothetical protein